MRSRGGFQAAFPLYHMNRHNNRGRKNQIETKQEKHMQTKQSVTNSNIVIAAFGVLALLLPAGQVALAQDLPSRQFVAPVVFQAAGSSAASIQSTVDAFRTAVGDPNNGNNPGPLQSGRREINWDG
ncbi:MAG TPA: hypothetical protein VE133_19550, partial [Candidatus Sulfotelmatobacter sp.]|nr:hypothetical protein [Candidatus Sulfotelmatobacter sp.]